MNKNIWDVKVVQDSLDHPECLAFGPSGRLYAGGEAGQVYRIDLEKRTCDEIARSGGLVVGVTVDGDENVYICDMKKHGVLRVDNADQTIRTFCDRVDGAPLLTPNFGVFHPSGDFYFTDSGDYWHATGRLIRVHPDGTSESLLGAHLNFPNGLALSSDARTLYMIESTSAKISRVTLEDDGSLGGDPETYGQLQGTVPDGMAFDSLGNLFVACYSPDIILKIDARRNVSTVIEDRTGEVLNRPTNVAFRPDMSTELHFANFGGWHIGSLDVGTSGQLLNYPKR